MKRFFILLLVALIPILAYAYDAEIDGIYYNFSEKEAEVTYQTRTYVSSYYIYTSDYSGTIVIPSSVSYNGKTYSVTSISDDAFHSCSSLTSVTIPNSVTSIREYAFSGCTGLTSVIIPNSVTSIREYAFSGCTGLTSVTIPNSVTSIDGGTFYGCSSLTSIVIPNGVTSIGDGAFYGCSSLTSIVIPNGVTSIGDGAFSECGSLISVNIPNSVTSIGEVAFSRCSSLTSLAIPNSVRYIGSGVFMSCSNLTSITVDIGNMVYDSRNGCNAIIEKATNKLITGCSNTVIPNSITTIDMGAFFECCFLTSIEIPKSVTSIASGAFTGCSGLTSIVVNKDNPIYDSRDNCNAIVETATNTLIVGCSRTIIPNSVTSIGNSAFRYCSSLTFINIPNSVTSIGYYAFEGCSKLRSISIPNGVSSIESSTFQNCQSLATIEIPNSVTYIGSSAFSGCSKLFSITIPSSVTSIGYWSFRGCSNLTSVTSLNTTPPGIYSSFDEHTEKNAILIVPIGSKNKYKSNAYWKRFSNVTEDGMPDESNIIFADAQVKAICVKKWDTNGDGELSEKEAVAVKSLGNVFYNNSKITSFNELLYFTGLISIESSAFYNCTGLTSVVLPKSVTSIGDYAFSGCRGLTSVSIPSSVTKIWYRAFSSCNGLTSIAVESGNPVYDSRDGCNAIIETANNELIVGCKNTTIPNSVTSIGESAFSGCRDLTSITIPNSVTIIGNSAFAYCIGLTSIEVPNSVTSIKSEAFDNCSGLQSVVIGNGVTSLPSFVFGIGHSLKSLTIGSGVLSIASDAFRSYSNSKDYKPIKTIWLTNTPPTNCKVAEGTVNYVSNILYTSLKNTTVYPFLSSLFEVNGVKYVPVSPSERTCDAIDCCYSDEATNINIGETVSYKGVEMTVQRVQEYACYQNPFIRNVESSFNGDIEAYAFYDCDSVRRISLCNGGNVEAYAFCDCNSVRQIIISNDGNIGESAFYGVSGDFTANINNQGIIGNSAFANSKSLRSLEIGGNVIDIGSSSFQKVSGDYIAKINNKGSIGQSAFSNSEGLKSLVIGNNVKDIGTNAFSGCNSITTAKIENNGPIANNAFYNCSAMTIATLGENITSIGKSAFSGCSKLQNIVISDSVKSLGEYAFQNCTSMAMAKMGSGIQAVNSYTFSGCSSLTEIEIGCNVKTIDSHAFSDCKILPVIHIPRMVTKIKDYVFSGCSGLKTFIMDEQESELTVGSNGSNPLFVDCPLDSVYIGRNITYPTSSKNGYSPFYRNTFLRSVEITDKETEISANEFYGCTNLKNVKIGNGVTAIGDWAFSGCSNIDVFSFGASVKTIGKEAFSDCTAMTKLMSHAAVPPTCGNQALDDINKWDCVLSIPHSYTESYRQADQWKEFFFVNDDLTIDKYSLIYMVDGVEYKTIEIECGAIITAEATPIKEGYTFSGWSEIPETMPAKDVVVKGTFTINQYKLTYIIDSKEYKSYFIDYNTVLTPESVPIKKGMTFSGWNNLPETMPANDVTITGTYSWSKKTQNSLIYQVTDTLFNYASVISNEDVYGDVKILPTIEIDGYHYIVNSIDNSAFYDCGELTSVTIPDNVTSIGGSALNKFPKIYVKRGTKALLTLWRTNYIPYETGTYNKLECSTFKLISTTQTTATFQISNRYNEYTYTCYDDEIQDNIYKRKGLSPQSESYVTFDISLNDYLGYSKNVYYKTLPISPTASVIKKTASSFLVKGSYIAGDARVVSQKYKVNGVEYEGDEAFLSGLDPNTTYSVTYTIDVAIGENGERTATYTTDKYQNTSRPYGYIPTISVSTDPLILTTFQPKVISTGNAIVAAESNLDDEETNVGFEWRRTDWTDDFASSNGGAYLFGGMMEGYIRNLSPDKLWKFRPYYESNTGKRYNGEWVGVDPSNTSYFEPTVYTYSTYNVSGNFVEVKGYAMQGSDNVTKQGFMYWKEGSSTRYNARSIPANAKMVEAKGNVMIATLENLDYNTEYCYVAFVTTSRNETFYGEEQMLKTGMSQDMIDDIEEAKTSEDVTEIARYDINGRKLARPQKGINIIRMSDGTSRKVMVK